MSAEFDTAEITKFVKSVRKAQTDIAPAVKEANVALATKFVSAAQAKASGVGGVAAKAAASLRAANTLTMASIIGGGARVPFFMGAEFGSKRFKQFHSWRGNASGNVFDGGAGYFLHPAIRENEDFVMQEYRTKILDAASAAFH